MHPFTFFRHFSLGVSLIVNFTITAQTKSDTLLFIDTKPMSIKITNYHPDGRVKQAYRGYRSDIPLERHELFISGKTAADLSSNFTLDQLQHFDENGLIYHVESLASPVTMKTHYIFKPEEKTISDENDFQKKVALFTRGKLMMAPKTVAEGHIGNEIEISLEFKSDFPFPTEFTLSSDNRYIILPRVFTLHQGRLAHVPIKVLLPTTLMKQKIQLKNHLGDTTSILIELNGHDLISEDFTPVLDEATTVILQDRVTLILKSNGPEKLIKLLKKNVVVSHFPYAKKRTEINLKGYAKGDYVLEAHDLGTNQVKYAKLTIK
jgi:hypothetical protein